MISPGAVLPESKVSLLHFVEAIAVLDTHCPERRYTRINCTYCGYEAKNTRKNINGRHSKLTKNEKCCRTEKLFVSMKQIWERRGVENGANICRILTWLQNGEEAVK